jgi:hypothetical protein
MFESDKIKHFILHFVITLLLGWKIATAVGITIELTQAEYGNADIKTFRERLLSEDTLQDVMMDGLGILLGNEFRKMIFEKKPGANLVK